MPLVRWAQRRLDNRGDVGWIADTDEEMVDGLTAEGYHPVSAYRRYQWDLTGELPVAEVPQGWRLRPLAGESEADCRRRSRRLRVDDAG
jgi:hypothetical protein